MIRSLSENQNPWRSYWFSWKLIERATESEVRPTSKRVQAVVGNLFRLLVLIVLGHPGVDELGAVGNNLKVKLG